MPSIGRPLRGQALRFRLEQYLPGGGEAPPARSGRSSRTLIKNESLRVVLTALAADGEIAEHQADGPITVHVLEGGVRVRTGEEEHRLEPGDLLSLARGVRHSAGSDGGGAFLLAIASG